MSDSKIIQFNPSERLPIIVKEREGYCIHNYVILDEKTRMLECGDCGQIIEVYDYMHEWAMGDRRLSLTRKSLRRDIKKLSAELEDLKREEKNIKARIRRANKG